MICKSAFRFLVSERVLTPTWFSKGAYGSKILESLYFFFFISCFYMFFVIVVGAFSFAKSFVFISFLSFRSFNSFSCTPSLPVTAIIIIINNNITNSVSHFLLLHDYFQITIPLSLEPFYFIFCLFDHINHLPAKWTNPFFLIFTSSPLLYLLLISYRRLSLSQASFSMSKRANSFFISFSPPVSLSISFPI